MTIHSKYIMYKSGLSILVVIRGHHLCMLLEEQNISFVKYFIRSIPDIFSFSRMEKVGKEKNRQIPTIGNTGNCSVDIQYVSGIRVLLIFCCT